MDIKIMRIKQVGSGFSVLVSNGEIERGFTFPSNEGWEDEIAGEPKYVSCIRKELEKQKSMEGDVISKIKTLEKDIGKTFKAKK